MGYKSDLEDSQPQLQNFVNKRVYNKDEANDVIQNTNLVAINKEQDYDSSKNFLSWIFGIAKFQIMAYLKTRKRNKILYIPEYHPSANTELVNRKSSDILGDDHSNPSSSVPINHNWLVDAPFSDLIREERLAFLKKLDNYLGNKEKIIFNLLVDGFDCHEIAKKTGFKVTNVTVMKSRVIKKIKEVLKKQREE